MTKNLKQILLAVLVLAGVCPALAYDFEQDGFYYNIKSVSEPFTVALTHDSVATNHYSGELVLPTSVVYHDTTFILTEIAADAFEGCDELTSVYISDSVAVIGDFAFVGCSSLTSIEVGENNTHFKSLDGVLYNYEQDVLMACPIAKNGEFTIAEGVVEIGKGAFYGCSGIVAIDFPQTLETIGESAFRDCSGISEVTIPENVASIGKNAFADTGLTTLNFNAVNCANFAENDNPFGTALNSLTIGEEVQTIPAYAFSGCTGLTSVVIPDSVKKINMGAFKNCTSIAALTIGKSVTNIDKTAFQDCASITTMNFNAANCADFADNDNPFGTALTSLSIGENVQTIPAYAFSGCAGLTSVIVPDSVMTIGEGAFKNCTGIATLTVGKSVNNIERDAFAGCVALKTLNYNATECSDMGEWYDTESYFGTALTTINIGANVKRIPAYAFQGCTGVTSFTVPEAITVIGNYAFRGCSGLSTVNFNAINCTSMIDAYGRSVFSGCEAFTTLNIGNEVKSIPTSAFHGCANLPSVTLPNSVTVVNGSLFKGCKSLSSVTFGNAVTLIKSNAFEDCEALTSITIPTTVTEIGEHVFVNTGWYNNQSEGNLYLDDWCLGYKGNQPTGNLVLNEGTKGISNYAFGSNLRLETVSLPESLKYVGNGAFAACPFLTSANLGNAVVKIGETAFASCTSLSAVAIPVSVEEIGNNAFFNTRWYNSQPDGILYLDDWCLGYKGNRPTGTLAFDGNTKGIANGSFNGCIGLASVVIPNNVKAIRSRTFNGCSNLVSLVMGSGMEEIGSYAFAECLSLDSVVSTATLPPVLGENVFLKTNDTTKISKLTVSCGDIEAYASSEWSIWFETIEEECGRYAVSISSKTTAGGNISFSVDEAQMGDNVLVYVTFNDGYDLKHIKAYNANDPTQIVPLAKVDGKAVLTYSLMMMPFSVKVEASFEKSYAGIGDEEVSVTNLYPNPTTGKVFVEADGLQRVSIFNTFGQKVFETIVSDNNAECDLSGCASGVYLMQIETSSGIAIRRVVLE